MLRLIRPVWESSERYWLVLPPQRQPDHRAGEHGALLAACAAGATDRAEALLRDHLTETANFIAALMVVWLWMQYRDRSREGCFRAFRANHYLGLILFVGTVADLALRG